MGRTLLAVVSGVSVNKTGARSDSATKSACEMPRV